MFKKFILGHLKFLFVGEWVVWGRSPPAAEGGKILGLIKTPLNKRITDGWEGGLFHDHRYHRIFYGTQKMQSVPQVKIMDGWEGGYFTTVGKKEKNFWVR